MPIKIVKRYTKIQIRQNPHTWFVFGDNDARVGTGGQAKECRDEPNAIGIRTKHAPTYKEEDFLSDSEYDSNVEKITFDFIKVVEALQNNETAIWPKDGIGTGIADLKNRAPRTLAFINGFFDALTMVFDCEEEE